MSKQGALSLDPLDPNPDHPPQTVGDTDAQTHQDPSWGADQQHSPSVSAAAVVLLPLAPNAVASTASELPTRRDTSPSAAAAQACNICDEEAGDESVILQLPAEKMDPSEAPDTCIETAGEKLNSSEATNGTLKPDRHETEVN